MSTSLACPRHPHLVVATTEGKGRSVLATAAIAAGEVLETSPVLRLSNRDAEIIQPTQVEDYVFHWDEEGFSTAIVMGITSLVNHSSVPNAAFRVNKTDHTATLLAKRDIAADEEITIDYGVALWFDAKE